MRHDYYNQGKSIEITHSDSQSLHIERSDQYYINGAE